MPLRMPIIVVLFFSLCVGVAQAAIADNQLLTYRSWVNQFKDEPKGPFKAIQWHCKDGSVLPPEAYACQDHGGGRQYGEWNERAVAMRENGYLIANILAAIDPQQFVNSSDSAEHLSQILLEQFLIHIDNGWVFRKAKYYRGAIQTEVEQDAATKIVLAMLGDKRWLTSERFLLLREAVRMLPITVEPLLGAEVRQMAADISERDPGFHDLRVKIHSIPDAKDSESVRAYAAKSGVAGLETQYAGLVAGLEKMFGAQTANEQLKQLHDESTNRAFRREMTKLIHALKRTKSSAQIIELAASKAQAYRSLLTSDNPYTVYNRLRFLRATLILEQEVFVQASQLMKGVDHASRRTRLRWLRHIAAALHATGMLSDRQWQAISQELDALLQHRRIKVRDYHASLNYLGRVSQWSQRALAFHFSTALKQWQPITPLVQLFIPDRLRGSPLLPYMQVLDTLIVDANSLSGMKHQLFGREVGSGLRALNQGLRRGVLLAEPKQGEKMRSDGIYILKSTTQKLTPIAGIITRGEGSSVSHVQLLARNMGIPNLVADDMRIAEIRTHIGERVVLAVSQRGVINIVPDHKKWDVVFGSESQDKVTINPDLEKLNLKDKTIIALKIIRATDSGRTVGPKAANLGQLSYYYPQLVGPGLVIPFGVFRDYMQQPIEAGGISIIAWMRSEYRRLDRMKMGAARIRETHQFLAKLRNRIIDGDPGLVFRQQLERAIKDKFGSRDGNGIFVRSDTNVEDLPGFNGAGLNLTVPNVVGFDAILNAVKRVWASPFSERAFAWRQSNMEKPEHVYPAVLLMESFPSEKSGVMVTADVGSGDHSWLTIAVNEGVGGAVDGQASEELRVGRMHDGVRLLSQATAAKKMVLLEQGGVEHRAASGEPSLLNQDEIKQLQSLAADVDLRFPLPRSSDMLPVAADIEFGFSHGHLALFQIRPFVESKRAWHSLTLQAMDRALPKRSNRMVDMYKAPALSKVK
ncbi:phosphoenolpyruvate synthase [Mariprofundus sp. EBB-1]|uniref:PEP/pyruvate-binding domain-containing protein n=1 Tax=Mariprofundus sp. EBB-1 TaxID=2650971 RepID=UPI000EF2354A|nr:PEP/pyruvate-binding domain-containing protein [Mariprofundus sp. EBB-1]RLL55081.1 phosphoenolpyruvate synthase [Mariprofundus sp. EBB-1]